MIDYANPPPVLDAAVREIRETLAGLKNATLAVQQRIAAIQTNRDLSAEARERQVGEQRAAVLAWYDQRFRASAGRVAEAIAAVEAAVEKKVSPDPFEVPPVDTTRATPGEEAIVRLTRAALTASARSAEQTAAQRADAMLVEALAADPVHGAAKLRRELADSGDPVLERAFDRVAPRRVTAGARELLEQTQAEVRDSRLDAPLRELVGQTNELSGLASLLVGLRVELERGELLETGRSAVIKGLEVAYPGIAG